MGQGRKHRRLERGVGAQGVGLMPVGAYRRNLDGGSGRELA
jgi:hypothetical protein